MNTIENQIETKQCEHHYESVIYKTEEWKKNYTIGNQYDYKTLTQENIKIFCHKCGDSKII